MDEECGRAARGTGPVDSAPRTTHRDAAPLVESPRRIASESDDIRRFSLPGLVTASLLQHDLPDSSWEERDRAARYVDDSIAAMPDFTRFGVRVAGAAAYGALCVLSGGRFRTRSDARRARAAARLVSVPLPILGEFGRLTRGLGLVSVHEQRHAVTGLTASPAPSPSPVAGAGAGADPAMGEPAP